MSVGILVFIASVAVFLATIYVWNSHVEKARLSSIRRWLFALLLCVFCIEVYAWSISVVRSYFLSVVSIVNVWGYLDAIRRYPSVPELESFLCLKLIACVITKTVAYSIGFIDIHRWPLVFLSALFLNVWLLPILYVLVIPYGDSSPFRSDQDMVVEILTCLVDSKEREVCLRAFFHSADSMRTKLLERVVSDSPMHVSQAIREKNWI